MKTDGEFTCTQYDMKFASMKDIHTIVLLGDIHFGSSFFASSLFDKHIAIWKEMPNIHLLLMGDYQDFVSSSERDSIIRANFHETTQETITNINRELVERLAHKLSFAKGRIIGVINGNHFGRLPDGTNTDQLLAKTLDAPYLGTTAAVRISIECYGHKTSLTAWLNHGQGGGRMPGGSINRVFHMAEGFDGDIYAMGHDHKRIVYPGSHLYITQDLRIKQRRLTFVRTGTYLKAYVHRKAGYIVETASAPSDLGSIELPISVSRTKEDGFRSTVSSFMR